MITDKNYVRIFEINCILNDSNKKIRLFHVFWFAIKIIANIRNTKIENKTTTTDSFCVIKISKQCI